MHLVMFDIDGTLVDSESFDTKLYNESIEEVFNIEINQDWSSYNHVTDSGILSELIDNLGRGGQKSILINKTKELFISKIDDYLQKNTLPQIPGAGDFINYLSARPDVKVTIATGGWLETAELKMKRAGISIDELQITSANDHYSRTHIMEIAELRTKASEFQGKTYFGDAIWDKHACENLGYNFVLVGNNIVHDQRIDDYRSHQDLLSYIGL